MIVHIIRDGGFVAAMGHRVALHLGGEPELKRRVLGTIAQLDDPPDDVTFRRIPFETDERPPRAEPAEPKPAPAAAAEAPPPAEPPDRPKPPPRRGQKGK